MSEMKNTKSIVLTVSFTVAAVSGGLALLRLSGNVGAWVAAGVIGVYGLVIVGLQGWEISEDSADSIYFLGFLFTVMLLALSFLKPASADAKETLEVVLATVGKGLLLTVWGLFGREIATLSVSRHETIDGESGPSNDNTIEYPPLSPQLSVAHEGADSAETSREVSNAVRRLSVVAGQIDKAATALADAAESVSQTAASLAVKVEESGGHIAQASHESAVVIIEAVKQMRNQLQAASGEIAGAFGSITSALDEQGGILRNAAESESKAALVILKDLNRLGLEASEVAGVAMAAVKASAEQLAQQAENLPDPSVPTKQYAEALADAATAVSRSGVEANRAATVVASGLGSIERSMKAMTASAGEVVDSASESLVKIRSHFDKFRELELEYVQLVEEVAQRTRKAKGH